MLGNQGDEGYRPVQSTAPQVLPWLRTVTEP